MLVSQPRAFSPFPAAPSTHPPMVSRAGSGSGTPHDTLARLRPPHCSIYAVHDDVKDKDFELEMSWVADGECVVTWTGHAAGQR